MLHALPIGSLIFNLDITLLSTSCCFHDILWHLIIKSQITHFLVGIIWIICRSCDLFLTLQQAPNTQSMLHSPPHWCEQLHSSNYCASQFNLKYELQPENIQQDSSKVMVCRFLCVTYLQDRDSSYTMSQQTGTQLLNATSLVQSQPYCCNTLVVSLSHKPWGWHKRQGGKRMK
jgi:hypothetical protein